MKQKLIIVTHDGAQSKVEALGFTGSACQAATAAIEAALGQTTAFAEKPEYWEQSVENQNEQKLEL